jgi:DNA polymerase III delta prime subunit
MEINILNKMIETSLNPYIVFYIKLNHTKEEYDKLYEEANNIITKDFLEKFHSNVLDIDLSYNISYILIKQNFIYEYKQMMDQCNLNYVMVDAIDELWELEDLTPLLNVEDLYFDDEFLEGLKTIVEHKYDIDDVLDKISRSSYQSLNVLNKHVLNKKSR